MAETEEQVDMEDISTSPPPLSQQPPLQTQPPQQPPSQQQQPQQQQNKKGKSKQPEHPCIVCGKNVTSNSVQCNLCTLWCHRACTNLSAEAFKGLELQMREVGVAYWACRACLAFATKVNRQLQAASKGQDELEEKVDKNARSTEQNTIEIEKLRQELSKVQMALAKEKEERSDMLGEELRDREVRRNNIIFHGVPEQETETGNNRDRMEKDRRLCSDMLAVMRVRLRGEDLRFCRRVGERGRDARPIVVGVRNEEEKRLILRSARLLRGTRYDNVSVVPDMTRLQRRAEDKLSQEAETRNCQLTEEDHSMNRRWLVVGKRGEKRLLKGTEREQQYGNRREQQLGDYMPNMGGANTGAIPRTTYQPRILDARPATNSNYTPIQHRPHLGAGGPVRGGPARGGPAGGGPARGGPGGPTYLNQGPRVAQPRGGGQPTNIRMHSMQQPRGQLAGGSNSNGGAGNYGYNNGGYGNGAYDNNHGGGYNNRYNGGGSNINGGGISNGGGNNNGGGPNYSGGINNGGGGNHSGNYGMYNNGPGGGGYNGNVNYNNTSYNFNNDSGYTDWQDGPAAQENIQYGVTDRLSSAATGLNTRVSRF
jgi:hypothetical protein